MKKEKCYVTLAGGLGNQLFQAAAGFAYSKQYGKELILHARDWTAGQGKNPFDYQHTIFRNFTISNEAMGNHTPIKEAKFDYTELPYHEGDVKLMGYFQSVKYLKSYVNDFVKLIEFDQKNPNWITDDTVAVHIRRGDYIRHAHVHYVCDTDYFQKNIEKFEGKKIHVYTDSPDHVQNEFAGMEFSVIRGTSELDDLFLMSQYKHIICSNSSFSWWASLLNTKPDNIIVPKRWFNNFESHVDIYRDDFIISEY